MTARQAPAGSMLAFQIGRTPVYLHWSLPLGGVVCAVTVHFRFPETFHICQAYACLLLVHEVGHAIAVRAQGLKVHSIEISGVGGRCHFQLPRTRAGALWIAAGGLLAQLVAFIVAVSCMRAFRPIESLIAQCFGGVFTLANALIFVANIVPGRLRDGLATDGFLLWALARQSWRGDPYRFPERSLALPPGVWLAAQEHERQRGCLAGVEIHNDDTTPMDFVVEMLTAHLGMTRDEAVITMLAVHTKGGVLIARPSFAAAQTVAEAIAAQARSSGFPFVCRAVDLTQPARPVER